MTEEARLFKALSDPIRLRLAVLLVIHGETCVCDLAAALDEPEYKISRHLGVLRAVGLVTARRKGTWMHYTFTPARSAFEAALHRCLQTLESEHPAVTDDLQRLRHHMATKGDNCLDG